MKSTSWKDIAETIALAAIVASLVFVGLELQQSQSIAIADRQSQQMEREFGLTDLISEHSALIVRINNGVPLTDEEELVADSLVRSIHMSYFFSWSQASHLNALARSAPLQALVIFLNDNPGLKERYITQIDHNARALTQIRGDGLRGNSKLFHDTVAEYLLILENETL